MDSSPHTWQVQEAKQRFSELLRRAEDEGPQSVTKHGEPVAVVIGMDDYRRLQGSEGRDDGFVALLRTGPPSDDLDLARAPDYGREVELPA